MPFSWSGGSTYYVTADDVLNFLKISNLYTSTTQYQQDVELLNDIIIPSVCVLPDEIILGDNKPISEYKVGEEVQSGSDIVKIVKVWENPHRGYARELKALGMLPIRVTANHPMQVVSGRGHKDLSSSKLVFKKAEELVPKRSGKLGDYLVMGISEGRDYPDEIHLNRSMKDWRGNNQFRKYISDVVFKLNEETAYIFGLYVAEGWDNEDRGISFAFHEKEVEYIEKVRDYFGRLGFNAIVRKVNNSKGVAVSIDGRILVDFFRDTFGHGAHNKKVPDFILYNKNLDIVRAFIRGYLDGDGNFARGKYVEFMTSSKVLALQLQQMFARIGKFCALNEQKREKIAVIQGRATHQHNIIKGRVAEKNRVYFDGNKIYVPLTKNEPIWYEGNVYNFTTENHMYSIGNLVSHNCDYIDVITGRTWGKKFVQNEHYSIGKPAYLGWYLVGSPVYLQHFPVIPASSTHTLVHLGVWNGTQYEEWVGTMVEARWGSYWIDNEAGILWIIGWYWYMGYEIEVSYYYGYNSAQTPQMDGQIYQLALYKSAKMFLDNERYTAQVAENVGGIEMERFYNWVSAYIDKLEDAVKGYKIITGSWVP